MIASAQVSAKLRVSAAVFGILLVGSTFVAAWFRPVGQTRGLAYLFRPRQILPRGCSSRAQPCHLFRFCLLTDFRSSPRAAHQTRSVLSPSVPAGTRLCVLHGLPMSNSLAPHATLFDASTGLVAAELVYRVSARQTVTGAKRARAVAPMRSSPIL
jgi:hypothetical protein